jgi:hypothetical protein
MVAEFARVQHQPEKLYQDDQDERQRKTGKKGRSPGHPQRVILSEQDERFLRYLPPSFQNRSISFMPQNTTKNNSLAQINVH